MTTFEKIVKEKGVVTVRQLSKMLNVSEASIHQKVRECERTGEIKTYFCALRSTHGSQHYRTKDFFNSTFIGKKLIYASPVEFAEFFEENLLKFELSKNLNLGKKSALTHHIKSSLPDDAVALLRAKYVRGKQENNNLKI